MNNSLFSNLLRALNEAEAEVRQGAERGAAGQLHPGDRVGDYVLCEHIATGGFGAVGALPDKHAGGRITCRWSRDPKPGGIP